MSYINSIFNINVLKILRLAFRYLLETIVSNIVNSKNISDTGLATGNYDLSDNSITVIREATPPAVEGGLVSTTNNQTQVTITVGDGIADVISFATTSTATANYTYIITDASGNILTNNDVSNDFEPAPTGT